MQKHARTITVDTPALLFTLKVFGVCSVCAVIWSVWSPLDKGLASDAAVAAGHAAVSAEQAGAVADTKDATTTPEDLASTLPSVGRGVVIDLSTKRALLYEDGVYTAVLTIVRAPEVRSPDRPSPGLYPVDSRDYQRMSLVTRSRFPYYVQFGDRYALSGPRASAESGDDAITTPLPAASIELSDDDARRVLEFLTDGALVRVLATQAVDDVVRKTPGTSLLATPTMLPATAARAFAVASIDGSVTYLAKNSTTSYPIASVTKLITAAVSSSLVNTRTDLEAADGAQYTMGDLYYPLFLRSDNSVAESIAANVGMQRFIESMNSYVHTLGMHDTSFADASGLSSENRSSAVDLVRFAGHLYRDKRVLLDMSREKHVVISSESGEKRSMDNQNRFASDPAFVGGKLGFTDEAGQTSLGIFKVPIDGVTQTVVVVVLGSHDWKQDTRTLLRWLMVSA